MSQKYRKSIINRSKILFEAGWSYAKIAKELNIKRSMTVFDWAKKFGWSRKTSEEKKNDAFRGLQESWIKLGEKCARQLLENQLENKEAIKVLKECTALIRFLSAGPSADTIENETPEPQTAPKAKVLHVLEKQ